MSVHDCRLIELPRITNESGSISFVEGMKHIPFEIKRIYYLYDLPVHAKRGAHGHKALQQIIIAMSGALDFIVDDGFEKKTFRLDKPDFGLYIPPMIWRDLGGFAPNTVCLVLASESYDEADYYRNYNEFIVDCHEKIS